MAVKGIVAAQNTTCTAQGIVPNNHMYSSLARNMPLVQDLLGIQSLALVEDPQRATLNQLLQDAASACSQDVLTALARVPDTATTSPWVAKSPVTTKLRLFCLPYAGGVSENVFARQVQTLSST